MMSIGLVQDAKPHLPFKLGAQQQSTTHLKSDASTVNISCRHNKPHKINKINKNKDHLVCGKNAPKWFDFYLFYFIFLSERSAALQVPVCFSLLLPCVSRKPAGDCVCQLFRRQTTPAEDHRGRLRADVHWDVHHRPASLHHWAVSEKATGPPQVESLVHRPAPTLSPCSYEFETSVRWVVNSTVNPSPCSSADSAGAGQVAQVPDKGENLHRTERTTCTFYKQQ